MRVVHARKSVLGLLVVVAIVATLQHHRGIDWGDDFSLYLRQAKSVTEGNIAQVISDNRFNVDSAAKSNFSPYVYPWVFPLVLAPFVRFLGLDYARLKLVEVFSLCVALMFFHEIVRRRTGPRLALLTTAVIGLSAPYLQHTDHLLSEFPYMALVFATFWWLDRLRDRGWPAASPRQLTVLGALMAAVFNTRREGAAMVIAVAAVMAVDLVRQRDVATRRVIVRPFAAAALIVVGFQLLLPSELIPDYYNNRFSHIWPKISGPFRIAFNQHLGLANNARFTLGVVLVLMILGIVLRLWRHLAEDLGFVVFAAFSLVTIGVTPYNEVRYLLPLTPFAVYFMVQALPALAEAWRRPQLVATARIGAAMLALGIIALNLSDVPGNVGEARRFNDRGKVVWGPENPTVTPVFDAVRTVTRTGDVIAFMKARAMTLYTDRRAVQSSDLEVILHRADYFAMLRGSSFSQPNIISEAEGNQHGLTIVWQDSTWILWRVHHP